MNLQDRTLAPQGSVKSDWKTNIPKSLITENNCRHYNNYNYFTFFCRSVRRVYRTKETMS